MNPRLSAALKEKIIVERIRPIKTWSQRAIPYFLVVVLAIAFLTRHVLEQWWSNIDWSSISERANTPVATTTGPVERPAGGKPSTPPIVEDNDGPVPRESANTDQVHTNAGDGNPSDAIGHKEPPRITPSRYIRDSLRSKVSRRPEQWTVVAWDAHGVRFDAVSSFSAVAASLRTAAPTAIFKDHFITEGWPTRIASGDDSIFHELNAAQYVKHVVLVEVASSERKNEISPDIKVADVSLDLTVYDTARSTVVEQIRVSEAAGGYNYKVALQRALSEATDLTAEMLRRTIVE